MKLFKDVMIIILNNNSVRWQSFFKFSVNWIYKYYIPPINYKETPTQLYFPEDILLLSNNLERNGIISLYRDNIFCKPRQHRTLQD